eukprot:scaffold30416_cov24-Cyclotella_meneghiniana.AAC.2
MDSLSSIEYITVGCYKVYPQGDTFSLDFWGTLGIGEGCARSEVEDKTQIIEKTAVVASITPSYADIHNLRLLNNEEEELFNSMEEFFESTIKTGEVEVSRSQAFLPSSLIIVEELAQEMNLDANLISNQVVLVLGLRSKTKLDKFSLTKKVIMKFRIEIGDKRFQQWGFVSSPEALS